MLAFDGGGNILVQRYFTGDEVTAKQATFALPKSVAGTTVEFYAVANVAVGTINNKAELLALTESVAAEYNGTFAEVNTKCRRSGGFLMTGSQTQNVAAAGSPTAVTISLKRTVAKVAIQTALSADFASKYPGKVKINTTTISKAALQTPYFSGFSNPGAMTFSCVQAPEEASEKYNNLFYLFENGTLSAGNRVTVTLEGLYDRDGNFDTTGDQTPVTYTTELTGAANGELIRNAYYRVSINVAGLTGQDVTATVNVADWQPPVTQSVNLGQ